MEELLAQYQLKPLKIEKLEGYGSINYRIETRDGKFILKKYPDPGSLIFVKAEEETFTAISEQLPFQLPAARGLIKIQADQSFTRLMPFLEGDLLTDATQSDALLFNFGKAMGRLDNALANITNPLIKSRRLAWDLQYCLLNTPKVKYIQDTSQRKLVHYFFDLYEHHVLPVQHKLRHSVIHSDLNDRNVIVSEEKIVGFIDFEDLCYAPLINEIAIALTYVMMLSENKPFHKAAMVLKGYHSVIPLQEQELKLLYYLIPARLCVSLSNSSEIKAQGRATDYILISEKPAQKLMEQWIRYNPVWVYNCFLEALDIAGPKSENILEKRLKHSGRSLKLSYDEPIHMTGAAFQYMYDNKGNTYLDARNNIPHVGHCHPKISRVISEKVRTLNTNTRYLYKELPEYTEKLLHYFPDRLNKVFFVNSGSAATDLAVRMANTYSNRHYYAVLEHGYHGNTAIGIGLSSYKFDGKGGCGTPENIIKLPLPDLYDGKFDMADDYVKNAIDRLQDSIDKGKIPAAFIAEPVSGCGGQVALAKSYLKKLKPFLEYHDIPVIIDEVQTGFGRLGSHFWGFEMHDIVPDIVILGKSIANGHPMGAVVTTTAIADAFANGMEFFSSFGGNPVSCATASAVLDVLEEEKLMQNAYQVGDYFLSELEKLKTAFPCISNVRGSGLFLGMAFSDTKGAPDMQTANTVKNKLKDRFILTGTDGPQDNIIKIKPPMCFTRQNANEMIRAMTDILNEIFT